MAKINGKRVAEMEQTEKEVRFAHFRRRTDPVHPQAETTVPHRDKPGWVVDWIVKKVRE
jgi:hypothetical protein